MGKQKNENMNEKMQELIIKEVGIIGIIALIGTIMVTCLFPDNEIATTLLFGAVTSIIGGLLTFLNTKNMSEKESEILRETILTRNEEVEDVQ